jgi:uncharacterized protein (DUF2235 family)
MKRLVICCDGTWNTPDQKDRGVMRPSNVVKLARWVMPQDRNGVAQRVHYDRGVGTGDIVDRIFGGLFGVGLGHNVREAYDFLARNYDDGDQVFLFGFSRGAYTVRRTVGMVRKCQLLPKILGDEARTAAIEEAYDVYVRREDDKQGGADSEAAKAFRRKHGCRPIAIRCLGVWDTVGAYGIGGVLGQLTSSLSKARFHDRLLSSIVEHAYQAVAIDEKRRLFEPTLFEQGPTGLKTGQVLEQSWFAGVHSNVGGGYEDTGLSDITLYWMATRAEQCGLALDPTWANRVDPDEFGELRESRTGLYLLLGQAERAIGGQKNGFEKAHNTSLDRLTRDPAGYAPENLIAYRDSKGFKVDLSDP